MTTQEPSKKPKNTREPWFSAASALVDLLLPPACRLCDEPVNSDQYFCHSCRLTLALSEPKMVSACVRCGRPGDINSANSRIQANDSGEIPCCSLCEKEKFHFDTVIAKWTYEGRVCDAIIAAKYARQAPLGHALGCLLGERVDASMGDDLPDVITFVPSSVPRQLSRGGRNGNVAIAEGVQSTLRGNGKIIPLSKVLRTTRSIQKQAWLSDKERRENARGAFAAQKSYAWNRVFPIFQQHILLVDDVLTTGATSNEVSRVLVEAGARRVTLAVVARAVWSK